MARFLVIYFHLLYSWQRPWAKRSKCYVLIGYLSGQCGPACPLGTARFDPAQERPYKARNFRTMPAIRGVAKSGRRHSIQRKHKRLTWIYCTINTGGFLERNKSFLILIKAIFLAMLLSKLVRSRWGILASFLFFFFFFLRFYETRSPFGPLNVKKNSANNPATLTEQAW